LHCPVLGCCAAARACPPSGARCDGVHQHTATGLKQRIRPCLQLSPLVEQCTTFRAQGRGEVSMTASSDPLQRSHRYLASAPQQTQQPLTARHRQVEGTVHGSRVAPYGPESLPGVGVSVDSTSPRTGAGTCPGYLTSAPQQTQQPLTNLPR
jgi:hypothetical protein